MSIVIITGSEATALFAQQGLDVVGIDNDKRRGFFGEDASTTWTRQRLEKSLGSKYSHVAADIRDTETITKIFKQYGSNIVLVIHAACFRDRCLTGPNHLGTQLHSFFADLMKCAVTGKPYKVYGYKRTQVGDNIHSAELIQSFYEFFKAPRVAEVYNTGGRRYSNCSMSEAINICQKIVARKLKWA